MKETAMIDNALIISQKVYPLPSQVFAANFSFIVVLRLLPLYFKHKSLEICGGVGGMEV
jgi:hypothetical protein